MFKIAEDESPWPRNRVYFNLNSYSNVPGTDDLTRLLVGLEKTFLDRQASITLRLPVWMVNMEPTIVPAPIPFGADEARGDVGDSTLIIQGCATG